MRIDECVYLNRYFICFYDGESIKYYNPKSIVDENGLIIYDRLAILLNRIKEKLSVDVLHIFYTDMDMDVSFILNDIDFLNEEERDSFIFKNVDTEKYESKFIRNSDGQVLILQRKDNIKQIQKAIKDLNFKVYLNDITEAFVNENLSDSKNMVYIYVSKEFYFYYIFKKGIFSIFNIVDKSLIYKWASSDDGDALNDIIDIGVMASILGEIRDDIVYTDSFSLKIFFENKVSDDVFIYLSTLNYDTIEYDQNFIEFLASNIDEANVNYCNTDSSIKKENNIKKYIFPLIVLMIFIGTIYSYNNLKTIEIDTKKKYEELVDNLEKIIEENNRQIETIEENNITKLAIDKFAENYEFFDISNLRDKINILENKGNIKSIHMEKGYLDIEIESDKELPDKYNDSIIKRNFSENIYNYILRFENEKIK